MIRHAGLASAVARLSAESPRLMPKGKRALGGLTRSACIGLLRHDAPNVRVHAARRLLAHWPEESARLAALWSDHAIVEVPSYPGQYQQSPVCHEALYALIRRSAHPSVRAEIDRLALDRAAGPMRAWALSCSTLDGPTVRDHALSVLLDERANSFDCSSALSVLASRDLARPDDLSAIMSALDRPIAIFRSPLLPGALFALADIVARLALGGAPAAVRARSRLSALDEGIMARADRIAEWRSEPAAARRVRALDFLRAGGVVAEERIGFASQPSEPYLAFQYVVRSSRPEEVRALLSDGGPAVRVYAARHLILSGERPESLAPLLSDPTPIIHRAGCGYDRTTVGSLCLAALHGAAQSRDSGGDP